MAILPFDVTKNVNAEQENIDRRRSEKAKAFNDYVKAQIDNGETVDPLALDRVRMNMAGGDPYMAAYIPSGAALTEMANKANERSNLSRMNIAKETAVAKETENAALQSLVDNQWDKAPEDFAKMFSDMFGPQVGAQMYDRNKEMLPGMLTSATNKKMQEYANNPAMATIQTEADLNAVFAADMRNPQKARIIKATWEKQRRTARQEDAKIAMEFAKTVPAELQQMPEIQDLGATLLGYEGMDDAPTYQRDLISGVTNLTNRGYHLAETKKKTEEIRAGVISSVATYKENAEDFAKAAKAQFFTAKDLMVKGSKGLEVDPRLSAAFDYASKSSEFFPSEENFRALAAHLIENYRSNPRTFDQAAAVEQFMASGKSETQSQWVDRMTEIQLTNEIGIPPGTNMPSWITKEQNAFDEAYSQLEQLKKAGIPAETLRSEVTDLRLSLQKIKNLVDAVQQDPTRRVSVTGFDYNTAVRNVEELNQRLRTFESTLNVPVQNNVDYGPASTATNPVSVQEQLRQDPRFTPSPNASRGEVWMKNIDEATYKAGEFLNPANVPLFLRDVTAGAARDIGVGIGKAYNYLNQPHPDYATQPAPQAPTNPGMPDAMQIEGGKGTGNIKGGAYNDTLEADEEASNFGNLLDKIAFVESGGNPRAKAATSSATGLFQFTAKTWRSVVNRYGAQHGISEDMIYDPNAQKVMMAYLTRDNMVGLYQSTGKVPNEADIYLAHFLGVGSAAKMINNLGTQQLAVNMFPAAANANRALFYKDGVPVTIEQLYETMSRKMKRAAKETEVYRYDTDGNPV